MGKYDSPVFDEPKRWIQNKRERGFTWDAIRLACKGDIAKLAGFLKNRVEEDDWPSISSDEWMELVDENEDYESKQQDFRLRGNDGALFDTKQDNGLLVPQAERSCWQLYKSHLNWKRESIEDLESATIGILRRLSIDTHETGPIKGLVIGHVQSGKTANMEALMAMAADHGWNFFIVLSGSIENLRLQTLRRMQKDLNHEGNLIWQGIEHPSKKSIYGARAVDLHFEKNAQSRYFTVCLKNVSRLKKLIDWIHADAASHKQMKILIIDDEADQASISNTATEYKRAIKERKGINKLIVDLVEDRHYKEELSSGKATAINYVMYTATPYANFLNECSEESLYPRHFIWTLKTPDEYIGPTQIYGKYDSETENKLDITRIIDVKELDIISRIYDRDISELPPSLEKAICWFICSVAVMRYWGYKKPISMLVHTSQKQICHEAVASAISSWINKNRTKDLVDTCKTVYEEEITRLPKAEWHRQFPEYGVSPSDCPDYPDFSRIEAGIKLLLSENMTHIKMSEEGDLKYHKSLHLVIDNCAQNGVRGDDYVRLAYPDPDMDPYPTPAPAFIIVGGSTLSRGLTIEGLVSTFFLRASCQADTLMQMGRWFGYRRGYEILPRIWMTLDTINKFAFLSQLEVELRRDLKKYMFSDVLPIEYGPKIITSPKVSWLRLTSRNHMRNAVAAEMDFSGAKPQTVLFEKNEEIQKKNISVTEAFIERLPGTPVLSPDESGLVWKNVPLDIIMDNLLIDQFVFSTRSRVFNEIGAFCDWIKQVVSTNELNRWSVVIAGKDKAVLGIPHEADTKHWSVAGYTVGKVNRSKKTSTTDDSIIDIGALRALKDLVADVPSPIVDGFVDSFGSITKQEHVDEIRKIAKMDSIPMLIIYRIDKDSKVIGLNEKKTRENMDMPCDIIGIQVCVPGEQVNKNFCRSLTIRLPDKDKADEVEENG